MELIDYIQILRRRWILIALVIIACVGGAVAATKFTTPTYQATSRLIVSGSSPVSASDGTASQVAAQRATAFAQIISTQTAVQAALKEAEARSGPFEPSAYPSVSASADGINPFITVDVSDTDPARLKRSRIISDCAPERPAATGAAHDDAPRDRDAPSRKPSDKAGLP